MIGIVEVGGGDAIFTIVEALNDGTLHPDLYKAIEPSLLFALRKPNGKPRPIAIGDILDVIAGQCVLAAKRIDLNTFLTSDADIRACLASGDWKQAFTTTPRRPCTPATHALLTATPAPQHPSPTRLRPSRH